MKSYPVCPISELPPGERKIIQADGRSIGVFNIGGELHALRNLCPHQFAPLCQGKVTGYCAHSEVGEFRWERDGEIIRCPWHAWEFDIKTGRSVFDPHKVRTKSYPVTVEPAVESYEVSVAEGMVTVKA
jgi:nitrite reductase/ring-hydroxylating ferredoxin subunit